MTQEAKAQGSRDLSFPEGNAGTGRLTNKAPGAWPGLGLATAGADANTHTQEAATVCTIYTQRQGPSLGPCIPYKYRVLSTKYR